MFSSFQLLRFRISTIVAWSSGLAAATILRQLGFQGFPCQSVTMPPTSLIRHDAGQSSHGSWSTVTSALALPVATVVAAIQLEKLGRVVIWRQRVMIGS